MPLSEEELSEAAFMYRVSPIPAEYRTDGWYHFTVYICRHENDLWSVTRSYSGGWDTVGTDGKSRSRSNEESRGRKEKYLAKHRMNLEKAFEVAEEHARGIVVNGLSPEGFVLFEQAVKAADDAGLKGDSAIAYRHKWILERNPDEYLRKRIEREENYKRGNG